MDNGLWIGITSLKVLTFTYGQWPMDRDHVFESACFKTRDDC